MLGLVASVITMLSASIGVVPATARSVKLVKGVVLPTWPVKVAPPLVVRVKACAPSIVELKVIIELVLFASPAVKKTSAPRLTAAL